MSESEVFHSGEIAVQERNGERAIARRRGHMIGDALVDGARAFVNHQGVAAVGAAAPDGALWASLWCGIPGFLQCDASGSRIAVVSALDRTTAADPVRGIVMVGAPLAMVVVDFETRRRLRINGTVGRADALGLELRIRETFGNCPKYIQRRQRTDEIDGGTTAPVARGGALDDERRGVIVRADTAFVASIHPARGLDVSHRGGHPGFINVEDARTLRIPDYAGNSMFQTLGNFDVDPRAGLAVIDFERRRVLSLTGSAVTTIGTDDPRRSTGGTGRYWVFTVDRWVEYSLPSVMTWTLIDRSPFNPPSNP